MTGPRAGRDPGPLQRHHRQHGGIAGGADGHGFAGAHAVRQPHQPVALDARLLRIAAEVGLAAAPAVEDHLIAGFPAGMRRGLHRAGEIDAGDHREAAHHRRFAGDREPVLVIHRRPIHGDGDVPVHQILLVEIGEPDRLSGLALIDDDRLESAHALTPAFLVAMADRMPLSTSSSAECGRRRCAAQALYARVHPAPGCVV